MNATLANIKALTFDTGGTGGTILDWHGGISRAFAAAGLRRNLQADWHEITNEYRRRSLKAMVGQVNPGFNFDDVHRSVLDEVIEYYKLTAFNVKTAIRSGALGTRWTLGQVFPLLWRNCGANTSSSLSRC